jgi:ubiquinol-cytochrome c reductase cytochrome c1 subunit
MTQASRIARIATLAAAFGAASLAAGAAFGASEGTHVERQRWSFSGVFGQYDQAQLQRGYQVYSEVCANCHELRRIHYRNLAQPGGPAFPKDAVAALAASVEVEDGPDDQGKMFQRPGRLSDRLPQRYKNEQEARSIHNGAYPPDLSLMVRARNVETTAPWYIHPFLMLKDIATANQDGGADYVRALLTGYKDPPGNVKVGEGLHYNEAFPGNQIAMAPPFAGGDGMIQYTDGTPSTVENYARDVTAFLAWTADPTLNERKQLGWAVMVYLLVTAVLLYFAKKRIWSRIDH